MRTPLKYALALAAVAIAAPAGAQVTFFEDQGFSGRSFTTEQKIVDLSRQGFNDSASSAVVADGRWEVCDEARYGGRCVVLRPGRYAALAAMGLNDRISSVRAVSRNAKIADYRYAPLPVAAYDNSPAQITFYEQQGFGGRSFVALDDIGNLTRYGFNDRASSAVVADGRWEVCEDSRFSGRCAILRPGRYPSLAAMGLNDRVSSLRSVARDAPIDASRYAPAARGDNDYRRANDEALYAARVTSVRAVVGPPEQRCWVERQQVEERTTNAVPGTIVGAVLGGILGHQVGNGRGQDLATAGGAVAGAVVGNRIGSANGGAQATTQDVKRCATAPSRESPEFWDVSYDFRGQQHRVQMTAPPGDTVTVNERGEPRS